MTDVPPLPRATPQSRRHRVANALNTTAIHALRAARVDDPDVGLTPERLSLLSVLVYGGPASMTELARAEQVSRPAITRIVTALEQAGLVRRVAVPEDRRQWEVRATRAGVRLLEKGRAARIDRLAGLLDDLSAAELDRVADGLALVRRALRASGPAQPGRSSGRRVGHRGAAAGVRT